MSKASVAGSLLAAVRLNLWGLGATLLGLQASRTWLHLSLRAGSQVTLTYHINGGTSFVHVWHTWQHGVRGVLTAQRLRKGGRGFIPMRACVQAPMGMVD